MQLLESLTIASEHGDHTIALYHGDLAEMPPEHAVDVLVVSAFPNNYRPTRRTLIAALQDKGISVGKLAAAKAVDLREAFGCWLSAEIMEPPPGIAFKRVLVFEPLTRGHPTDTVGEIFQALMPFVHSAPHIRSIAMPLVATGNQRQPIAEIMEPLIDAAANWFKLGLPVETLKIVEKDAMKAAEMKGAFAVLKRRYADADRVPVPDPDFRYDLFISYAHENVYEVSYLYEQLHAAHPDASIFLDKRELNAGAAWQQSLYDALEDSRHILAVYSPDYITSKVCKEEFNIGMLRHRDAENEVLVPLYLYSAKLPSYMQLIQYIDCREGDRDRLKAACEDIWARG